MPGAKSRRSMAHLGLSQRLPLRYSLMPSRRQSLQTESVWRAMSSGRGSVVSGQLHTTFFRGAAAVVRQRGDVLDGLHVQASGLQGGDGGFPAGAGALDLDLDLLDAELGGLLGAGLGGALGGERGALAAALEADGAGAGVAERVAVGVGDRDDGVVERRLDVGDAPADVAPGLAFLALGHSSVVVSTLLLLLDALLAGDCLARALAGAGVGAGALAADRQTAAVAQAAVALDVPQPGDVLGHLPPQRAFHQVVAAVEQVDDAADLLVAQLLGLALRIDPGLLAQLQGQRRADAVEVAQGDVRRLVIGDVHTQDTRHGKTPRSQPWRCLCRGLVQMTISRP